MANDTQDAPSDRDEGDVLKLKGLGHKKEQNRNHAHLQEEQPLQRDCSWGLSCPGQQKPKKASTRGLGQQVKLWEAIESVWPGKGVDGIVWVESQGSKSACETILNVC